MPRETSRRTFLSLLAGLLAGPLAFAKKKPQRAKHRHVRITKIDREARIVTTENVECNDPDSCEFVAVKHPHSIMRIWA